jgi:hypothetical protein
LYTKFSFMDTVIKLSPDELTHELVDEIKAFLNNKKSFEIIITIKEKPLKEYLFEESPEEYVAKLNKSISDVENNRNLVSFTVEEFEKLAASLMKK